jgi:hypothetical protein
MATASEPAFYPHLRTVPLALVIVWLVAGSVAAAPERSAADLAAAASARVQAVIDQMKARLGVQVVVKASLVSGNPLLVSVEPGSTPESAFHLSFDQEFLAQLDDDELTAVVAHELGHVWIFTHHPYLQTERLANDIAMRVVSRDVLVRVYTKVWERSGSKGDVVRVLGAQD